MTTSTTSGWARAAVLCLAASAGALAGCGVRDTDATDRAAVVVFAASSLADAFADVERGFEAAHPGVDVQLSTAGSQVLRLQLEQGASADVFASANEAHASALRETGLVGPANVFARNELVVIVPTSIAVSSAGFDNLPDAQRVVLGRPDVPVGAYARHMLARAREQRGAGFVDRIEGHVVSEEHNTRLVRAKVELGEADAAVVYRTDARDRDGLRVVPIPPKINVAATYVATVVRASGRPDIARTFVDYLRSDAGQAVLAEHGFLGASEGTP